MKSFIDAAEKNGQIRGPLRRDLRLYWQELTLAGADLAAGAVVNGEMIRCFSKSLCWSLKYSRWKIISKYSGVVVK